MTSLDGFVILVLSRLTKPDLILLSLLFLASTESSNYREMRGDILLVAFVSSDMVGSLDTYNTYGRNIGTRTDQQM